MRATSVSGNALSDCIHGPADNDVYGGVRTEDYEISQEDFDEIDAIGRANQVRGNIPIVYSPKWDIDVFGTPEEKGASRKVW